MSTATAQRPARVSAPAPAVDEPATGPGPFAVRAFLVLGSLAILGFWWLGTPSSLGAAPGTAMTSFGELAGLLGSFFTCAQVLLVARVPWFERAVGFDKLVSWHRTLGTTTILMIGTHVVAMVFGAMLTAHSTPWSAAWSVYTTYPDMLKTVLGTIVFVVVGMTSARLLRRHLSYEAWFLVHATIYGGIFLTFFHQISGGTHFISSPIAKTAWFTMYAATALSIIWYRVGYPLLDNARMRLTVEAVVVEAKGTTSVWLRGKHIEQLDARGGQFFLVRFLSGRHIVTAHPYSLSMVPTADRLRFTVGAIGDHSTAVRHLRPGTRVFLEGPFGRFTTDRSTRSRALLVAGGVGIGPVRALAEELVGAGRDVVVLHRAHTSDRLALSKEFPAADTLHYVPLPGRRRELGYDPLHPRTLGQLVPDIRQRDVFICGPAAMTETVAASARALGVPRSAIHFEELSLS